MRAVTRIGALEGDHAHATKQETAERVSFKGAPGQVVAKNERQWAKQGRERRDAQVALHVREHNPGPFVPENASHRADLPPPGPGERNLTDLRPGRLEPHADVRRSREHDGTVPGPFESGGDLGEARSRSAP